MSRLTLRLPDTLHSQLESRAKQENVSLNQYLVYALTRHVAMTYMVMQIPEQAVQQQREAFAVLIETLGQAPPARVEQVLTTRDKVESEPDLDPQVIARLQGQIGATPISQQ